MKFFLLHGSLWCREPHGRHQLVVPEHWCFELIKEAHNDLGHKGVFTVQTRLLCFWWPMLVEDVKWFVQICHKCQICQTHQLHIPPTVPVISGLFCKVHVDTMVMPWSASYWYIVQACCALTAYPKWRILRSENSFALTSFIFEDILCCWGALAEIVTDNGPAFVQALDVLADRYNIQHICISPYNFQANGVVEQHHLGVRETITKSTPGGSSTGILPLTQSFGPNALPCFGLPVCLHTLWFTASSHYFLLISLKQHFSFPLQIPNPSPHLD